jgi:two-component system OmpR family sensor kinase
MSRAFFPNSIRWRLQLWLAFLLICVLSGFGVTVFQLHRLNQFNQIDEELQRRVAGLSGALRGRPFGPGSPGGPPFGRRPGHFGPDDHFEKRPPPPDEKPDPEHPDRPPERQGPPRELRLPPGLANSFDETDTNTFYFVIWARSGTILKASTNSPVNVVIPEHTAKDTRTYARTRETYREVYHFTEMGDCVLAGHSVVAELRGLSQFTFWLIAAGLGVLALGCGGGWWLATSAIRPVEEISAAASRISAGNLSERIQEPASGNELGRLARVLNSTFGRLDAAFAQQKQFTADASHELRTPLAVLISETQTTLARERSAAEYRETVEVCLDTAQEMKRLTESLLTLARVDAGADKVREPIDLRELASTCVSRVKTIVQQHGLELNCELETASAVGNPERIAQVITNLLTNAVYYNKPSGKINVTTGTSGEKSWLTITDTGNGIAPEDLPHIFERFYRADKSRSNASGRTGLGLAICKAIMDAEEGSIEVSSQPGQGTTFTISFSTAKP